MSEQLEQFRRTMQIYWSWKQLPEFQQRSKKEYRQALWKVGLMPLRHLQVWCALLVASLVILLGLEAILVQLFVAQTTPAWLELIGWTLLTVLMLRLICRHTYFLHLRGYIAQVSFDPAEAWWRTIGKSALIGLVPYLLMPIGVIAVDWVINSFDESLDTGVVVIKAWPTPIPDKENGFVAMLGIRAPVSSSPFEAGHAYVSGLNQTNINHAKDFPKGPAGLTYYEYAANTGTGNMSNSTEHQAVQATPSASRFFCRIDQISCWSKLRAERSEVTRWLEQNKLLLNRYIALREYPQWQYPIRKANTTTPSAPRSHMIDGQQLLHAAAMLSIEGGQIVHGLDMIGADLDFVRRTLTGDDDLVGKMVSSTLMTKDFAWLLHAVQEYPVALRPHATRIAAMLQPLTPKQATIVDSLRFEDRLLLNSIENASFSDIYRYYKLGIEEANESSGWSITQMWIDHHFRKNASANLVLSLRQRYVKAMAVNASGLVCQIEPDSATKAHRHFLGEQKWAFNHLGRVGISFALTFGPEYAIRLCDVNALNNLVRVRLALLQREASDSDVPAFLNGGDLSLRNPGSGMPYEWDAQRKQVFFIPASEKFKKDVTIGGVPGRTGFFLTPPAK
jgi:hypothetical protein